MGQEIATAAHRSGGGDPSQSAAEAQSLPVRSPAPG
jgi:hypothetical protein